MARTQLVIGSEAVQVVRTWAETTKTELEAAVKAENGFRASQLRTRYETLVALADRIESLAELTGYERSRVRQAYEATGTALPAAPPSERKPRAKKAVIEHPCSWSSHVRRPKHEAVAQAQSPVNAAGHTQKRWCCPAALENAKERRWTQVEPTHQPPTLAELQRELNELTNPEA